MVLGACFRVAATIWACSSDRAYGRTCCRGYHVKSGGGDLLGMVGFGFGAEDCSGDVLELLGECQLNQAWAYVGA